MGVDYSSTAGYGFVVKNGEESVLLQKLLDEDSVEEFVNEMYPELDSRSCGDLMGDDFYYFFFVKPWSHHIDLYDGPSMIEFDAEVDRDYIVALEFLRTELGATGTIGWKLFHNVS